MSGSKKKSTHYFSGTSWASIIGTYILVLVVWTFYRRFFHASIWLEEIVIKGAVFSLPLFIFPLKTKMPLPTLGISRNHFFQSVYLGIMIGMLTGLFGQAGNLVRHGHLVFSNYGITSGNIGAFLILSLITGFWEQLLFSGYIAGKITELTKDEGIITIVTGVLFSLIHLPIYFFVQQMPLPEIFLSAILLVVLQAGCVIIKLRSNNLIAPIMAQALWGVTVFLFR